MMQDRKGQQTQQQSHSQRSQTPPRASAHTVDQHVGRQVALLRLQSRMTQTELARIVGISVQQLQKYESARNRISASMLFEIAKAFGVPVSRLFDGLPGNGTSAPDAHPPIHEHIAFAASMEGRRLNDGLLALPPRVRHRISSFVAALGEELSDAVAAETDPATHRQQCEEECNH